APPPRTPTQRTAASLSAENTPARSPCVSSRLSAFRASGRFSVIVATPASRATRTAGSGMGAEALWHARDRRVPVDRLFGNRLRQERARLEELLEVDAGGQAHALEHEHQVLGHHVAARAGRERAAAEAAHGAVEMAHAFLVRGERVGEAEAACVVKVRAFQLFSNLPSDLG